MIPQRKKKKENTDGYSYESDKRSLDGDDLSDDRRIVADAITAKPAASPMHSEPVSRYAMEDSFEDSPSLAYLSRSGEVLPAEKSEDMSTWENDPISMPEQSYSMQLNGAKNKLSSGLAQSDSTLGDVFDTTPNVIQSYAQVPLLELTKLPRGGVSMETEAVGRVQVSFGDLLARVQSFFSRRSLCANHLPRFCVSKFGIPPETIKDSMRLGLPVPAVYIVPVERFCREMGPALGVNLAEFEFPAYFNFFIHKKECTLIVDSEDAEQNIRRVFSETLLGPAQFRREKDPIAFEEEDFAPDFPREAIPNFQKELEYFRIMPDGKELVLETLLKFCHFEMPGETGVHENLGVPPPLDDGDMGGDEQNRLEGDAVRPDHAFDDSFTQDSEEPPPEVSAINRKRLGHKPRWAYAGARWIGELFAEDLQN